MTLKYDATEALILESADIPEHELKAMIREAEVEYFPSLFRFLKAHKGLRPGNVHLLIGCTGSGKTTLLRSIVADTAKTCRVVYWLSEELEKDFLKNLGRLKADGEMRQNIFPLSEVNPEFPQEALKNPRVYRELIEATLINLNPHVVFFDNLTTSSVYQSMSPGEQAQHCLWLKKICLNRFALVVCCHTKKGVYDNSKLFEVDDIRANAQINMIAEFAYTYQRISCNGKFFPVLMTKKARDYTPGGIYLLEYEKERKFYTGDKEIKFEDLKKIFNNRDRI